MVPRNKVPAVLCSTDLERSQDFFENKVGLEFDLVEFGDLKLVDHVLTSPGLDKSAWFKAPHCKTLSLCQPE